MGIRIDIQLASLDELIPQLEEGAKRGDRVSCAAAWRLALEVKKLQNEVDYWKEETVSKDKETIYFPAIDDAITLYLCHNNMTQEELATEMGMATNTFSWKRRGVREWSLAEATKICRILGMSLEEAQAGMQLGCLDSDNRKTVA